MITKTCTTLSMGERRESTVVRTKDHSRMSGPLAALSQTGRPVQQMPERIARGPSHPLVRAPVQPWLQQHDEIPYEIAEHDDARCAKVAPPRYLRAVCGV